MRTILKPEKTKYLRDIKDDERNSKLGLSPILKVQEFVYTYYADLNNKLIKRKLKHQITHECLDDAEGQKLYDQWKEAIEEDEEKNKGIKPKSKPGPKPSVKKD